MAWFKVDDRFPDHRKVIALMTIKGWEKSIALWTLTGAWASGQEQDGMVPVFVVKRFGFNTADASRLVHVGIWEEHADGYKFHDWADNNPIKSELQEKREQTKNRVTRWREKERVTRLQNAGVTPPVTPLHVESVTLPPSRPVPSRPEESKLSPREEHVEQPELPPAPSAPPSIAAIQRLSALDAQVRHFGYSEALAAVNSVRGQVGHVIHMGREMETALMAYADVVAISHPADPAARVAAAHAAWLAKADAWTAKQRYPLAQWLKNPEGELLAQTSRPAKPDGYKLVVRPTKAAQ